MKKLTKEDKKVMKHMLQSLERIRDADIDAAVKESVTMASAADRVRDILDAYDKLTDDVYCYFYD